MSIVTAAPALVGLLKGLTLAPPAPDRSIGAMTGLACGNALGAQVDGFSREMIARSHWPGVRGIDPGERSRPLHADLAQAIDLAAALLETEPTAAFAERLLIWYRDNGRGATRLTRSALLHLSRGATPHDAGRLAFEADPATPNGSVARTTPVALRHAGNPEAAVRLSADLCAVTHHAAESQWSCIVFCVALIAALNDHVFSPADLADALSRDGAPPRLVDGVRSVMGMRRPAALVAVLNESPRDDAVRALLAVLWALQSTGFPDETLQQVVSAGGDPATNGAVAGAALGARHGCSAWPAPWLDAVPAREAVLSIGRSITVTS